MLDLVIPDAGPLITFGLIDRLDLLDRFKCPILITDFVCKEFARGLVGAPNKAVIEDWLARNRNRIQTFESEYLKMWEALYDEVKEKVKRTYPQVGDLSIREFADHIRDTVPEDDQILILFEAPAVKKLDFHPHVHLIHSYAFMLTLERLNVIPSSEALYEEVRRRGRSLARDTFERRAFAADGSNSPWQTDYRSGDEGSGGGMSFETN